MTIIITDTASVIIDERHYSITKLPPVNDPLVLEFKKQVSKTLRIDNITADLKRAAKLMELANNGVMRFGDISAKMIGLQDDLFKLCDDSITSMTEFSNEAENILDNITSSFSALLDGDTESAVALLAMSKTSADTMSATSHKIADRFETLADKTVDVAKDTTIQRAKEITKAEQLQKDIDNWTAEKADQDMKAKAYAKLATEFNTLSEQAHSEEKDAREKKFILDMTKTVVNGLSSAVQGIVAAKSGTAAPAATAVTNAAKPAASIPASVKTAPLEAKETLRDEKGKKADEKKEGAKKESAKKPKSVDDILGKKVAPTDKVANTKEQTQAGLKATKAAADSVVKSTEAMSKNTSDAIGSAHAERMAFLRQRIKYENMRIESAGNVEKLTEQIKDTKLFENLEEVIIKALGQSVKALLQVSTSLRTAGAFWELVSVECHKLSSPRVEKLVSLHKTKENETKAQKELRMAAFTSGNRGEDFHHKAIMYITSWMGVKVVADDYITGIADTRRDIRAGIDGIADTVEGGRDKAQKLSVKLNISASEDVKKAKNEVKLITAQIKKEEQNAA